MARTTQFVMLMSPQERQQLAQLAERRGQSSASVVRALVERELAQSAPRSEARPSANQA